MIIIITDFIIQKKINLINFQVKLINDPFIQTEYMLYLFKYDSTHGTYPSAMEFEKAALIIGNKKISTSQEKNPLKIKWSTHGVHFVIESTGVFTSLEKASVIKISDI